MAAGKGVYICENKDKSISAVKEIFNGKFGKAKSVLIEEFLEGEEMSFFIISDGKPTKNLGLHKIIKGFWKEIKVKTLEVWVYSPSRLENKKLDEKILEKIIKPTLKGLNELNTSFCDFYTLDL